MNVGQALSAVPASRTKAKREHRVPLSPRALETLERAREIDVRSTIIFGGRQAGQPMSNMVFLMILRRMQTSITAHGFRSSFRDWAAEATSLPREVAEMAFAHTIKDKVEAAYRRGNRLAKLREMMG